MGQSRNEDILQSIVDATQYTDPPKSRVEDLLLQVKEAIEEGGGGGGTSNYNDLSNKPQIGGTTLTGNKSASDLGLVAAETGKGLSTNDYTNEDKAIVGGVTAALAGKQDALTAGKYIDIDANNEISVEREIPNEAFTYTIQQTGDGIVKITKTVSGAVVFEETYSGDADVTLDAIHYVYNSGVQSYTLLIASDTHEAGFKQVMSWWQRVTYTENFSTVDHSGEKLIIKSELDTAIGAIKDGQSIDSFADVETALSGKQATLTFDDAPTDGSNNPVKSNGIYDALATKQNATDNNLTTTDKTVVGAINEHESDISSLMSGLTNLDADIDAPNKKNFLQNTATSATQPSGITYTVYDDGSVKVEGEATDNSNFTLNYPFTREGNYILSGCPSGGSTTGYSLEAFLSSSKYVKDTGNGANVTVGSSESWRIRITVASGTVIPDGGITFYPMLRLSTVTDATYTPYIPSVESRLEAVESGDYKVIASVTADGIKTYSDLFSEFFTSLTGGIERRYKLIFGQGAYAINQKGTNHSSFGRVLNFDGAITVSAIDIKSNNTAKWVSVAFAADGTATVTDNSANVPSVGTEIKLVV